MGPLLICALVLAAGLVLGFFALPLWAWTAAGAVVLFIAGGGKASWIVFALVALVFNLPPVRRIVVTLGVMKLLRALHFLPRISETEKIALDAGTVWVDKDLFSGRPDIDRLLREPYPSLNADEQAFIDGPVENVCAMVDDWRTHVQKDLSEEVWATLKREKFFGLIVSKKYGGLGLSASGFSAVIKKLASRSFPLSVTVMIPNSLGPAELLAHYGTEAQKDEYLPKLASGEHIPCFALTEPQAGSDAGSITARGLVHRGSDGRLMMRLDFTKRYISLATRATLLGLAFKLEDPENLLGKGTHPGITCALIPTSTPGVVTGRRHDPLGVPFHNCPVEGHDVIVPVDCIIGGPDGAGQGWRMLMECLAAGRGVALPASSVAAALNGTRVASTYSAVRRQFGLAIGRFEGIEEPLARLGGLSYLMEATRRYTLGAVDAGAKPSVISAIVKYQMTELSRKLTNDAMDVVGGAGISRGPRNLLAGGYMAAPVAITVEGANILTRTMIIFGQGAFRCHPYAYGELMAFERGDSKAFDRVLWSHIGHVVKNGARAVVMSLSRGHAAARSGSPLARFERRLAWTSASYAFVADLALLTLGGDLKRREKLAGRMADILSWMYLATATLRRFEAEGRNGDDLPAATFALDYAFARIQEAFDGVYSNFPVPVLGAVLRWPVAFWSRLNPIGTGPSDELGARVAASWRDLSPSRTRWLDGMFTPKDDTQHLRRLERAQRLLVEAQPVLAKIREASRAKALPKGRPEELIEAALAAGVIDSGDAEKLRIADAAQRDAVQVDSFAVGSFATETPTPGIEVAGSRKV